MKSLWVLFGLAFGMVLLFGCIQSDQEQRNSLVCTTLDKMMNPDNLPNAKAGTVCAKYIEAKILQEQGTNLSGDEQALLSNGARNDSILSYDCSDYRSGPKFQLLRECKGETGSNDEPKFCRQTDITADCLETSAQQSFEDNLAGRCGELFGMGQRAFTVCGIGDEKDRIFDVQCESRNLIPNPFGLFRPNLTPGRNCAETGETCTTENKFKAICAPKTCISFSGETGETGSRAVPAIRNYWDWGDAPGELPLNALEPNNPDAVYGDAHQFFIVLFKRLKQADDLASENYAENQATVDIILNQSRFLLKRDNYSEAFNAFANAVETTTFLPPSWVTAIHKPWIEYMKTENGERIMRFEPSEIAEPGEYKATIELELNPLLNGYEHEFFVLVSGANAETGQVVKRYNSITVRLEKVSDPIRTDTSPLYWISLDNGLVNNGSFGTKFVPVGEEDAEPIPLSSNLTTASFENGKKTVRTIFDKSFAVQNSEYKGYVLTAANDGSQIIYLPNKPVSIAGKITLENENNLAYHFIQNDSSMNIPGISTLLNWNLPAVAGVSCDSFLPHLPRTTSDEPVSADNCPNGFKVSINDGITSGKVFASTTIFAPFGSGISMEVCAGQLATKDGVQSSLFELNDSDEISSIDAVLQGIRDQRICVITENSDGEPLLETRFTWNKNLLEAQEKTAVEQFNEAGIQWCEATVSFCSPLNVDAFNGIENGTFDSDEYFFFVVEYLHKGARFWALSNALQTEHYRTGTISVYHQNLAVEDLLEPNPGMARQLAVRFQPGIDLGDCDPRIENPRPSTECQTIIDNRFIPTAPAALDQEYFDLVIEYMLENNSAFERPRNRGLGMNLQREYYSTGKIPVQLQKDYIEYLKTRNRGMAEGSATQFCRASGETA